MTSQETKWMTIREAALALAVSELTVRRRIKDGRLRHQLVNGKYFVDLQSTTGMLESDEDSRDHSGDQFDRGDQAPPFMTSPVNRRGRGGETLRALTPHAAGPGSAGIDTDELELGESRPHAGIDIDALLVEQARLAEIAGRAGLLQEQYSELSARHEELRAGMLSLAGRNGWLESKLEERESEIKLLTDQQPHVPWWKRLFRH
jgi:excisionase family DNA binding protein